MNDLVKNVKIKFGATCPDISMQLIEQGLKFDKSEISHRQKDADSIIRLRVRGYIPDSQINKLYDKLFKMIQKHLNEKNK